jgi:uncharacterized protein YkwD
MDGKSTSALFGGQKLSAHSVGRVTAVLLVLGALGPLPALRSEDLAERAKSPSKRDLLEKQTLDLINRDRLAPAFFGETRGRARPLLWDDRLAAVARAHSEEMVRNGYFGHDAANGASPADRISSAGILWTRVGENIASCQSIAQAESTFMDEPKFEQNHRWNILNPDYTRLGVGIAKASDGMLYITEDFVRLR